MSRTPRRFDQGLDSDKTFKIVFGIWIVWAVVCLVAAVAAIWFVVWVVLEVMTHFGIL